MRLDKALTLTGLTRSQAKKIISQGRAHVGGLVVRDPAADVDAALVTVDGAPIRDKGELILMLHKPAGVLTATEDARLPTVMEFIPEELRRKGLGPIGRLDRDVTGLVIMTTDGQLAHRLISPRRHVEKVYLARVEGDMDADAVAAIERGGLEFSDFVSRPAKCEPIGGGQVRLTLTEGKYHEVKRICAKVGHPVIALKRESIAGVTLDPALEPGCVRRMSPAERAALYSVAGMDDPDDP